MFGEHLPSNSIRYLDKAKRKCDRPAAVVIDFFMIDML